MRPAFKRNRFAIFQIGVAVFTVAVLVSSCLWAAERKLAGAAALQLFAGKSFKFICDDQMNGYGRFNGRSSAWASYKYSTSADELERRSEATIRVNGDELCFRSKDLIGGEMCAAFAEKSSGIYRATNTNGWCDLKVIGAVAKD